MYYYKHPYIIFRDYSDYGYLTDNRNFGYDTASRSSFKFGDRILSQTGSVFYSVLTETPRSLHEIAEDLCGIFPNVSLDIIAKDAEEFYLELSVDGFVGQVSDRSDAKVEHIFSYENRVSFNSRLATSAACDEIANDAFGEEYKLASVHINVSGPCNEHCVHCYIPATHRKSLMPRDLFLELLDQCKQCHVLNVTLSGGEPLLNPELAFFIDKCKENNFSTNILSNLTLLTKDLVEQFKNFPLLSVQTSLYSMNGEIHDSITRIKGSFERTRRAIEVLRNNDIPLQINVPVMKQNMTTYKEVLNWAKSLNVEANSDYLLLGCIDGSAGNLDCRLELSEVESIILQERGVGSDLSTNDKSSRREYSVCPVCLNSLCVSYNGDVYPCEGWQKMCLGNIKEVSLQQIWDKSARVSQLRKLSIEADFPQCAVCEDRNYCSLCLIRNANESMTGDYKELNQYFCDIAKIKRRLIG